MTKRHVQVAAGALMLWALAACTRSMIAVALPSPPARPTAIPQPSPTHIQAVPSLSGNLAVVGVERGEVLRLRGEAGIASEPVEEIPFDARDLVPLGKTTLLGSSPWSQVQSPSGIQGWVPSWFLTEQVGLEEFCDDPRVRGVLGQLRTALLERDPLQLSRLVTSSRGLILRQDAWNREVRIEKGQLEELFQNPKRFNWGEHYISETEIVGEFSEVFLPKVLDVIEDSSMQTDCLDIRQGVTQHQVDWPDEYANLPYYGLYRPAPLGGNPFSWRSLVVGIEYLDGDPYVAVLLLVQPPI